MQVKTLPVNKIFLESLRSFTNLSLIFLGLFRKALNATLAVQRLKSRQSRSEADQSTALINHVLNPELSPSHSGNVA